MKSHATLSVLASILFVAIGCRGAPPKDSKQNVGAKAMPGYKIEATYHIANVGTASTQSLVTGDPKVLDEHLICLNQGDGVVTAWYFTDHRGSGTADSYPVERYGDHCTPLYGAVTYSPDPWKTLSSGKSGWTDFAIVLERTGKDDVHVLPIFQKAPGV
ncbi:uncharacterized protein PFL1_05670 [Pseudozyma flocculosa PF-1]|uniref:Uncharacterized protein n=2 Tax=Pseudozyma flocculosa TaxID=84751 RepID=A0A5C3FBW6_9BASI|nr:uncharacterized protein PFL1_05670 [Pseudozyma flocculosa PF-1]EPQ26691.1 hypothetical protein PFL1_05670 [Pseudozyma flocculosa PF-1]SPO40991.1 uncharacterized protein PSFLO_06473 [Pseudozyma flocculosa]